jgi:competence protein ComEC
VIALLGGGVSVVAVPANAIADVAVAPATLAGIAATVVAPVWPDGAGLAATVGGWSARWLVLVATTGARLPGAAWPWPATLTGALTLALLTAGLVTLAARRRGRWLLAAVLVPALVAALGVRVLARPWPPPDWLVISCDVGQGDATLVRSGPRDAVLVDVGPEPKAVDTCLRRAGVARISLLVVTHFHVDHVGGLAGAVEHRPVDAALLPLFDEPPEQRRQVVDALARQRVPVLATRAGEVLHRESLRLRVLVPDPPITATRSDPNSNSLVLVAQVGPLQVLLAGDAEPEELHRLGSAVGPADVLKVPHHGSRYQDPETLARVRPRIALISAGVGNSYGHPATSTLETLEHLGAQVGRTDVQGGLAVVARQSSLAEDGGAGPERGGPRGPILRDASGAGWSVSLWPARR